MKLWLLQPFELLGADDPWNPWYDKAHGFVVRAECEADAREFAHGSSGDETPREKVRINNKDRSKCPWLQEKYSACTELLASGDACIVLRDFASA